MKKKRVRKKEEKGENFSLRKKALSRKSKHVLTEQITNLFLSSREKTERRREKEKEEEKM